MAFLPWLAGCACNRTSHAAMSGGFGGQGRRRGQGYLPAWQGASDRKLGNAPAASVVKRRMKALTAVGPQALFLV
ncbi:MAG: hypothetical protein BGO03_09615 [Mesorhizobium sp. 61-13]|nr:MAG: hypothetical protein BGO03_09615 [Mesorhizobium sp. 61-13]